METHSCDFNRDQKILQLLTDVCFDLPKVANVQMSAALVLKNEIISIGSAIKKTHPFQKRFSKHPESIFLHAETHCIYKALRKISLDEIAKATLYICRIKQYDSIIKKQKIYGWGIAKPCVGCMAAIVEFGINTLVYTTNHTELKWCRLSSDL